MISSMVKRKKKPVLGGEKTGPGGGDGTGGDTDHRISSTLSAGRMARTWKKCLAGVPSEGGQGDHKRPGKRRLEMGKFTDRKRRPGFHALSTQ